MNINEHCCHGYVVKYSWLTLNISSIVIVRLSFGEKRLNSGNLNGGSPAGMWLEAVNGLMLYRKKMPYTTAARNTVTAFLAAQDTIRYDRRV